MKGDWLPGAARQSSQLLWRATGAACACAGLLAPPGLARALGSEPQEASAAPAPKGANRAAQSTYATWLRTRGGDTDAVREATLQGPPGWSFFYVARAAGAKVHAAAVSGHVIVASGVDAGWHALLLSPDLSQVHRAVAWLNGNWSELIPDSAPARSILRQYPKAAGMLTAPERWHSGRTVTFRAWYFAPPARTPFRVTIEASEASAVVHNESMRRAAALAARPSVGRCRADPRRRGRRHRPGARLPQPRPRGRCCPRCHRRPEPRRDGP